MTETLSAVAAPLLQWFEQNKRPLPWRSDTLPYHVWISEIMLQQTRIEAVMGYYARFTAALPDVESLSKADDERLLKLWEGLGYYSRARNLKKAAQMIMNDFGGAFPNTFAQLIKLPGVGEYTAGAIASICFNERVPAVDGNVLRVTARLCADRDNVLLPAVKRKVTAALQAVMPPQAGAFNEALMELGETVCLPGEPLCARCPLRHLCQAHREGLTAALPVRVKKTTRRQTEKTVLLLQSAQGNIAIEKRPQAGLLSGMYQLPNVDGHYSEEEICSLLEQWELAPQGLVFLKNVKHVFTHIDWLMKGYRAAVAGENSRFLWVTPRQLKSDYPLPTAFQKFLVGFEAADKRVQPPKA